MKIRRTVPLLLLVITTAAAQPVHEEGSIIYLSADMVYTDLGKNAGVAIGDSLEVKRKTDTIGFLTVTNLSKKSSVGKTLWAKVPFQVGDRVVLEKVRPADEVMEVAAEPEEVTAEASESEKKPKLRHRGKISFRNTHFISRSSVDGPVREENRFIGIVSYSLALDRPSTLSASVYGRSAGDGALSLYHAKLELTSPDERLSGQAGRIYASNLSGIGTVDGVLVQYQFTPLLSAGAVGGVHPDIQTGKASTDNVRAGGYLRWQGGKRRIAYSGNIAAIGQYQHSQIDREFIYVQNSVRFARMANWFLTGEIDLDRKDRSIARKSAELSSFNTSLRLRPWSWLTVTSRFSARKNVKYFESHASIPDSLFNDQMRSGWFNSIYVNLLRKYSFQLGHNYRSREEGRKASQIVSISGSARGVVPYVRSLRGTVSLLSNEQVDAVRSRISAASTLMKRIDIYGEYEWYRYRFAGVGDPNIRHTVTGEADFRFRKRLYLSALLEYSRESDLTTITLFGEVSYRF